MLKTSTHPSAPWLGQLQRLRLATAKHTETEVTAMDRTTVVMSASFGRYPGTSRRLLEHWPALAHRHRRARAHQG